MTNQEAGAALPIVRELRKPTQWCCIIEHEGHMRHGTKAKAPFEAADIIENCAAVLHDLFRNPEFQVGIGGNPNVVERLIARSCALLAKLEGSTDVR